MTIDQILRNIATRPTVVFMADGVPIDPSPATATVTITKADGTAIATSAATARTGVGTFEYALAPQALLNFLTLDWTAMFDSITQTIRTQAEVVGGFLFSIADARAAKLSDTAKYPTKTIVDVREEVSAFFADYCLVSFAPRFARVTVDGSGLTDMYVPNRYLSRILSVTVAGTAATTADVVPYNDGLLYRPSGWPAGRKNVVVEYEHGYDKTPGRVSRAALQYAQTLLVGTDIKERATMHTDETGSYRLSIPDAMRRHPTGVPLIDAILNEFAELALA